ncbi:N-acetylmuramoyl-L-alanine amidase [Pseudoalteromonas ruthenica]|uniref:N-acetylmuramoyl-L-alanine amidase AmiC n=1 Tax=Pseudoalteromonas ruthenica TaxID=151081 RepID=A0A0F4PQQ2_9GAMM|nr:N-acetylmuramoyl-L-alanine amidase [Pseudoalteromonas ruthenica]KJY97747.1 N-acetylmuramoyl-L-alanine amidase [Pseudoalteromonas ruthenica]KJZ01774.1 N-acetylmuramoyl-L-alanine amidase [Pseudoalteromonas ruthenica]TMO94828.1 AMIN domain-containing protein [Pseudoalteromonas ruthenica]TMO99788.1 AMIN domain-containing protein [Pseudoalteromonas ruthenica]TMP08966.1 AMIN domain-containing protein [Pseudoalteromonas ruthenica]|tara:strand:- start:1213 stop:2553 length:1341 start_codon:yes stop_codon:yes gene_type:complete
MLKIIITASKATLCAMLLLWATVAAAKNTIENVRVWPSPDSTRVVFDMQEKPDFSYFMLKNPLRLVVDINNTAHRKDYPAIEKKHQIVDKIRPSTPKKSGSTRVVFELLKATKPVIFSLAPTGPYKDRLVIDLYDKSDGQQAQNIPKNRVLETNRDIVIAIDAGHGGEDPGSIGPSGTYEKDITLQVAKRLERLINAERGMQAYMVRSGDYYVKLNNRSTKARKRKADFLVSIHADAFTSPQPRGASVWVLSLRRANSEIGKWIEDREKHSELLGGAADAIRDTASEKYLAQTLLDMSMDHSMKTGFKVAEEAIKELRKVAKMHKRYPQAASLAVLKSPDIPSILVETGFISNPQEERLLKTAAHQEKLAKAVFRSIRGYYRNNPPDDSLFATIKAQNPTRHKIRRGESLSVVASRYGVSVGAIKRVNKLKTDTVYIGQVLTIPNT